MFLLTYFPFRQIRKLLFLVVTVAVFPGLNARTSLQLGDSTGLAGNTIDVPLNLFTGDVVSGAQIDLYADPAVATIATVTGSLAGAGHIVDSEDLGEGKTRVVVYSPNNSSLFSNILIDLQIVLKSTIEENERSVIVESVKLADESAGFVNTALVPHATFSGPDSSVVYKMGDEVSASSVAFDTNESVDRVEFLVDGWPVVSDTEPPYEMIFPLHYFGNVTLSARAVDNDGNMFESTTEDYVVTFPPTLADWLDVFFTPGEQSDPNIGALLADIDLDNQATLMEYAMGLHPRRRDGPRESGFFQDGQTGVYQFGYLRPVGVTDILYTLQVSNDMETWSAL
ncbi:MAG: hypothetical protein O7C75_01210, partial [Verrucomicrobia bacterium]|nr:hypothetical protein [Verrucomicrobiota bacterium]